MALRTPGSSSDATVQDFIDIGARVTEARSGEDFYASLKEGYLALHGRLINDPDDQHARALRRALAESQGNLAVQRALQLCAMPLYEKAVLPAGPAAIPEYLWLFATPVLIRFEANACRNGPLQLPDDLLPVEALALELQNSARLAPQARVRVFPALYARADVFAWGPENMALSAVNAEVTDAPGPASLPISFSPELQAYQTALCFVVGMARLPFEVKSLLLPRPDRTGLHTLEGLIASALGDNGVLIESVQALPLCPMTSTYFVTSAAFLGQVAANCSHAIEQWEATHAQVRFPMPGYVEIDVTLASGEVTPLMLPEPCCEPHSTIIPALEQVLAASGLSVLPASVATSSAPTGLQ